MKFWAVEVAILRSTRASHSRFRCLARGVSNPLVCAHLDSQVSANGYIRMCILVMLPIAVGMQEHASHYVGAAGSRGTQVQCSRRLNVKLPEAAHAWNILKKTPH
jgi:hypothetical protein